MSENAKEPVLPKGLIGRKGAPSGKSARLPSLRGPRDLTLGGVPKKVFTPTIPTRRDKTKDEQTTDKVSKPGGSSRSKSDRGRGRGRGKARESTLVQSHSIFEQGPAQKHVDKRSSTSYNESGERSSSKMSVKKEKTASHQKDLEALLRDDFIDDGDNEESDIPPVTLPLAAALKSELKTEVKPEIKQEPETIEDESKSSEDVEMITEDKLKDTKSTTTVTYKSNIDTISCRDIFTKCGKTESGELMFLQLPDTLPGLPPSRDEQDKSIKCKTDGGKDASNKDEEGKLETEKKPLTCSLSDFSEGFIGKLQIRKSGKTELLIGNVTLDVTVGTPSGFLQELVSVKTTEDCGHMSVLGQVQHRLICTPNFESLLKNS